MKKLAVTYCGWGEHWQLGTLADDGEDILFEYSAAALERGIEFSPYGLPLRPTAFGHFPPYLYHLPGLVADALPDGWGMLLMDRLFRKQGQAPSRLSPLERLAFIGQRAMGALSFAPAGAAPVLAGEAPDLLQLAQAAHVLLARGKDGDMLRQLAFAGGAPQGSRPKALVMLDAASGQVMAIDGGVGSVGGAGDGNGRDEHGERGGHDGAHNDEDDEDGEGGGESGDGSEHGDGGGTPWIVKFPGLGEHKEVCAVEHVYAELARACGLDMPATVHIDLDRRLAAFGAERFDRQQGMRVPVHTLAGALQADFRQPGLDYSTLLRATRLITRDVRQVRAAFERCVFNVVFHNRDDHARNFAYRMNRLGHWELAPCYDLSFNPGPGDQHQMAVMGKNLAPGLADLLRLAADAGLPLPWARSVIENIAEHAPLFTRLAKTAPIRAASVKAIARAIEANRTRMLE